VVDKIILFIFKYIKKMRMEQAILGNDVVDSKNDTASYRMSVTPGEYRYRGPVVAHHALQEVEGVNASRVVGPRTEETFDAESALRGLGTPMTRYASALRPLPSSSFLKEQTGDKEMLAPPEVRGREVRRGMGETSWEQAYNVLHAGSDAERDCVTRNFLDQSSSLRIGTNARLVARSA